MNAHDNPTVLAVVDLINDTEQLAKGVAAQAKIIRELREELSKVTADRDTHEYNVEFLKRQGRITRLKLRSAKRGRKQAEEAQRRDNRNVYEKNTRIAQLERYASTLLSDNRQLAALAQHFKTVAESNPTTSPSAAEAQPEGVLGRPMRRIRPRQAIHHTF